MSEIVEQSGYDDGSLNTEERLLAALSHAAIMMQYIGMVVGLVVYITQRDKSEYAAKQGLQAAIYQLVFMIGTIVMWIFWGLCYMITLIPLITTAESGGEPGFWFWVSMFSWIIPLGLMVIPWLYGLWGALRTWQGHDFRYIIIGDRVANLDI